MTDELLKCTEVQHLRLSLLIMQRDKHKAELQATEEYRALLAAQKVLLDYEAQLAGLYSLNPPLTISPDRTITGA